ncbi:sugar isomerase [Dokdonia pacifica]|uniref:Membrane protein involved in the export of O-antigen and teichoic acid n=1 Tax=Dokdonia pacifica TaxID=1627892 RepID=A0A239A0N7_9FLAO|nr:sugar isomerase [Dokdonia pacifica]GGG34250.1 sugar isomerase [Dokdonia pacifica]SNR88861.1 Membrane protein involved in the export of O-antigen and teichoic acid [Dokdonia pacifica]
MLALTKQLKRRITPEQFFMISVFLVNGGNYLYNLVLGRVLGPKAFSDAVILITLLLVLSFIAMTFQLAVAKFTVIFESATLSRFIKMCYTYAVSFALVLGAGVVWFAKDLHAIFRTESHSMFVIFGIAIPIYFIMSVRRGELQGSKDFINLSITYQLEMFTRLALTFLLISMFQISSSIAVAIGIGVSFLAGVFPLKKKQGNVYPTIQLSAKDKKSILNFFILTGCYELTQIICNNSDILLVKHYFPAQEAGLYASLALIGRVVYFVTWMFVMLLLPTVVDKKKKGENTKPVLLKYTGYIIVLACAIVGCTFLFPVFSVQVLFGDAYISIAPLLGWYALATSFFAVSNIFAYYFLSLDHYIPVLIAALMGGLQIVLIVFFHHDLFQVVLMQVLAMGLLLVLQVSYFLLKKNGL